MKIGSFGVLLTKTGMTFKNILLNATYLLLSTLSLALAVVITGIIAKGVVYLFLLGYRLF